MPPRSVLSIAVEHQHPRHSGLRRGGPRRGLSLFRISANDGSREPGGGGPGDGVIGGSVIHHPHGGQEPTEAPHHVSDGGRLVVAGDHRPQWSALMDTGASWRKPPGKVHWRKPRLRGGRSALELVEVEQVPELRLHALAGHAELLKGVLVLALEVALALGGGGQAFPQLRGNRPAKVRVQLLDRFAGFRTRSR